MCVHRCVLHSSVQLKLKLRRHIITFAKEITFPPRVSLLVVSVLYEGHWTRSKSRLNSSSVRHQDKLMFT